VTPDSPSFEGLVRRVDAKGCEVVPAAGGDPIFCTVRARVHKFGKGERSPLAAGDRVTVLPGAGGASIESVLPRRSRFARESSDGRRPQVVAANVDVVVALLPAAEPAPNLRLTDRVLVTAAWQNVEGLVVVSKTDLVSPAAVEDLESVYRRASIPVVRICSVKGEGMEALAERLRGRTSVLVGPSGAGKSTLLKALLGPEAANIGIGAVNAFTGKGRHTTVACRLIHFPGGGWVVDTPGVRSLALPDLRPADLPLFFPDLAPFNGKCRFQDCTHRVEPGCAAAAAAAKGEVDPGRLESYRAMFATLLEDDERRRGW
jgi:ribosome biogenesis GTPase